ncbi:hypothetical protein CFII64_24064 [Pseudomonas sp. CFII64]|uniref:hypothetical protein n=1 Tax=Pseudomonas sp. CFII64 TaxID=911242 RepID=UPI0003580E1C|nr:hypothetical protein [Pseudomonas sp. CFII64]EPJ77219.1 hypothetical protein CFII64_24064 [Pseudomonas sp. CFII64]
MSKWGAAEVILFTGFIIFVLSYGQLNKKTTDNSYSLNAEARQQELERKREQSNRDFMMQTCYAEKARQKTWRASQDSHHANRNLAEYYKIFGIEADAIIAAENKSYEENKTKFVEISCEY